MRLSRNAKWGLLALVLAVVAGAGLALRGKAVQGLVVQQAPMVRTLQFSARVAALSRVEVGATVTSRVARVPVREGDRVRAGDALVVLETDELQAALAQAQASERQAQARLAGLRSSARQGAQAALAQSRAGLQAAQSQLARVEPLVAQGFYSPAQRDEARRALEVAQAQFDAAQAQSAANAETGTEIAQAQAQLALSQAATEAARARLSQAVVRAPADARVLLRSVEPGQIVQPGKALLRLALEGPTQLVAPVDERFLQQLQVGQPAAVVADAFADQRFAAQVLSVAPAVDAQRGAIEVKLALTGEPPAFLREDMTLSVEVETARRDAVLTLPLSALREAQGAATAQAEAAGAQAVMVLREGRAVLQPVQLGLRTLQAAEVLSGLHEGDTVLLGEVQAGQRVRAVPVSAGAPASGGQGSAGAALTNAMGR